MKKQTNQNANFSSISKEEKRNLKHKITNSIYSFVKRRKAIKYGIAFSTVAASILLLLSLNFYHNSKTDLSPIEVFAKTLNQKETPKNIQLILNNNQGIEIADSESTISYSHTGNEVSIGNSKSVTQDYNNTVFNTLIVPYGKRSEISLSDGSKVWLNSGSKLIFPATFDGKHRVVYLEGEAIFDVTPAKNQPFIVKSGNHNIEVLGTLFNVTNYTDENTISTVLKSGSVQLNFKGNSFLNSDESITITPGTLAVYNREDKHIKTQTVDTEKYFSWRDGILIFKNDSMRSIMKKISRYYNVEIIINDETLANETFSGYLDVKEHIESVIQIIKETETSKFEYYLTKDNKLIIN